MSLQTESNHELGNLGIGHRGIAAGDSRDAKATATPSSAYAIESPPASGRQNIDDMAGIGAAAWLVGSALMSVALIVAWMVEGWR